MGNFFYFKRKLRNGNTDGVRYYLSDEFVNIIVDGELVKYPIHVACESGYINIVKLLLERNCNVECADKTEMKPIHYGCNGGYVDIVKLLLERNCNIECETIWGLRPIHYGCSEGHVDIVRLLLEHNCNVECETTWRMRPIHYGCNKGHVDIVRLLLERNCNVECEDRKGLRPIHYGCENKHVNIVKLLLERNCDIECEDKKGWKPIHNGCSSGYVDIVRLLLERNCNVECEDNWGMKPIHNGCSEGHVDVVRLLLERNCNVECEDKYGWRPIHHACKNGHGDIIQLLIDQKCQIDCKNKDEKTPFDMAKTNNKTVYKEVLLPYENRSKFFASIKANDITEFGKLYNSYNLATQEYYTELSVLEVALINNADKIIKYINEKSIDDAEISDLTKALKDIENVESAHLIKECILYRCIMHRHAEGFKKFNTANIINGHHGIVLSSFLEMAAECGCGAFINEIMKKTIYKKETWEKAKNKAKIKEIEEKISERIVLFESWYAQKKDFLILHSAIYDNDDDMVKYILDNPNLVDPSSNNIIGPALALAHSLHYIKCINILEEYQNTQNKFSQFSDNHDYKYLN